MTTQEIIDELSRAKHRGFAVWRPFGDTSFVARGGGETFILDLATAAREAAALRRNREALSLDAVMPVLEAIVAEADALDENDVAPVADYLDVSGYVSTTIGQLRAVVAAWKARRQ